MVAATRTAVLALALTLGLAANAGSTRAQPASSALAPVWEKIDDIRYAEAAELLTAVLERGGLPAGDLADAHRLGGEIFAALGDAERARDHFARWLVLDPGGMLPPGTSPKIATPFIAARARAQQSGPLRVRSKARRSDGTVTVELVVEVDPFDMVSGMRVTYGTAAQGPLSRVAEVPDALTTALEVADRHPVRMTIAALDDAGNELAVLGADEPVELPPLVAAAASVEPTGSRPRRRPWYEQWYTWAGVAGVTGGAAMYFGYRARTDADAWAAVNADSAAHDYGEARALERRVERNSLLANIGFGAAGVAAVAAIVCGVRGTTERPETVIAPLTSSEGAAGVTLQVRF